MLRNKYGRLLQYQNSSEGIVHLGHSQIANYIRIFSYYFLHLRGCHFTRRQLSFLSRMALAFMALKSIFYFLRYFYSVSHSVATTFTSARLSIGIFNWSMSACSTPMRLANRLEISADPPSVLLPVNCG